MAVCNTQYYWYDERGKKVKCTAPQYVDFVMSSVQKLVTDEDVFPTKYGMSFAACTQLLMQSQQVLQHWTREFLGCDCKWGLEGLQFHDSSSCLAQGTWAKEEGRFPGRVQPSWGQCPPIL